MTQADTSTELPSHGTSSQSLAEVVAELRAKLAKASMVRSTPRDPNGPTLQCPKCGGQHYDCYDADEGIARLAWDAALHYHASTLLDAAEHVAVLEAEINCHDEEQAIAALEAAMGIIAQWPITHPENQDAHNMQLVAIKALKGDA